MSFGPSPSIGVAGVAGGTGRCRGYRPLQGLQGVQAVAGGAGGCRRVQEGEGTFWLIGSTNKLKVYTHNII